MFGRRRWRWGVAVVTLFMACSVLRDTERFSGGESSEVVTDASQDVSGWPTCDTSEVPHAASGVFVSADAAPGATGSAGAELDADADTRLEFAAGGSGAEGAADGASADILDLAAP